MAKIQDGSAPASASTEAVSTASTGVASAEAGTPLVRAPGKVMVIIHGAGVFPDDYYKPLVAAIEQRLGGPFHYVPVYYADITNPPGGIGALDVTPESPDAVKFKQSLMDEMQRAYDAQRESLRADSVTANVAEPGNVEGIALVQALAREVTRYLFTPSVTSAIQQRLIAGLDQAVPYGEIILASLSLGTVVSFDVLKQSADHYKISTWFTTGCPLGKLRRVGIRSADLGAISPTTVGHWLNLYDTNDIVASPLGPQFPGYRLYDVFVEVGTNPLTAHDYFNNPATWDLMADAMR
jgi:hypothetical protein